MGTSGHKRPTLPVATALPTDRRNMRLENEALCSINDIRDAFEDILSGIILAEKKRLILKGDKA